MKDRFVPPELQALLGDPMIDIPVSGGGGLQSIGNGRYAVTLPDGQQVIVDQLRSKIRCLLSNGLFIYNKNTSIINTATYSIASNYQPNNYFSFSTALIASCS